VGHRIHGDRRRRTRRLGWEYVHVAIDDCTRVGYAEVLEDERGPTTAGFLARARAWYAALGIRLRRVLSDNGKNYRSHDVAAVCRAYQIRQQFTRPYRPQTNGKAERFIRTLLHEWAYAQAYGRSVYRTRTLPAYLHFYNSERRHTALAYRTPLQRLATKSVNNVLVNNI
jgi:transposase InsO family protein